MYRTDALEGGRRVPANHGPDASELTLVGTMRVAAVSSFDAIIARRFLTTGGAAAAIGSRYPTRVSARRRWPMCWCTSTCAD